MNNINRCGVLVMVLAIMCWPAESGDPIFDPTTLMRLVLVPADAAVGSVIYRIRAHDKDFDYPLQFDMIGDTGRSDVSVETLPCTRYNSVCQANVVLQRRLEPGRYVDFRVVVRNTKGRTNRIQCSITATNATTPRDAIFPHIPALIMVPEDAKRGTELDYIVARKNPLQPKAVYLELWGSPLFAIRQKIVSPENTEGTIFLIGPLDFETQSMYHLTVLANDAYAEPKKDSRNIAGIEVVIVVQDVQDMPPVFTSAPPVTHLQPELVPGDIVVRVHAEDGDKGAPRQIRYGLVSEGNPFTSFFNINETTGDVILEKTLDEIAAISHVGSPVLLTVIAEEIKLNREEPEAMSATVQLAFIMPERGNSPPYFESDYYIARINENSPQGTALLFMDPYVPQVNDDDAGKNGVFSLSLLNNNGTFEISPNVGERRANFIIKVRDNRYLDYEVRQSVVFQIIAQELTPSSNMSTVVNVTVYINDVNDNPPKFLEETYEIALPENATAGTRVVQVRAEDIDTGIFGKVQYTAILGYLNTSLHLDSKTGVITVATNNHGFDREAMPDIRFLVEARDNDGIGNRATVPLIITLLDVNDETPEFERPIYEFILSPGLNNFTSPAIIKAVDKDAEPPNNIVRYEIIHGNYENKFVLNEVTGELLLLEPLKKSNLKRRQRRQFQPEQESEFYVLTARAYDLGIPHRFSTTVIRVYPPESKTRTMLFVVPGSNPDRQKTENILSTITGGKVSILEIRPYKGTEVGVTDVTGSNAGERSVVVATVLSTGNSLVDVSHIQQQLSNNKTIISTAAVSSDDASVTVYKAENKVLFWLLIFLAICIILALMCLILCCICDGCPLYMPPRKRVIRVNSTDDDVHLVVREKGRGRESKSVQAAEWCGRKEAWSAARSEPDARTKPTQWRFNRRNNRSKEIADHIRSESAKGRHELFTPAAAAKDDVHSIKMRDGPNIIYTKNMQDDRNVERNIYVEHLDRDYSRIASQRDSNKNLQVHSDVDADSIRRHEIERGSDIGYLKLDPDRVSNTKNSRQNLQLDENEHTIHPRDQLFIKDGNTEILRLVTRDGVEEERYVNLPVKSVAMLPRQYLVVENGKDILMQRYIEDQGVESQIYKAKKAMEDDNDNKYYEEIQIIDNKRQTSNQTQKSDFQNFDLPIPGSVHDDNHMTTTNIHSSTAYVHQELLETSLRQQNELLRQILLDKEKNQQLQDAASQFETRLETQSLPGHSVMATQTDCHMGTQTEPHHIRPARRKARSDVDESYSEEEFEMVVDRDRSPRKLKWIKRKRPKRRKGKFKDENPRRSIRVEEVKRKIRTPILEETDVTLALDSAKSRKSAHKTSDDFHKIYGETRTSILRKLKNETSTKDKHVDELERPIKSALKKEVLMEISKSLDDDDDKLHQKRPKLQRQSASTKYADDSDDSLSDENNENYYKYRRDSNDFTDDSLENYDKEKEKRSTPTKKSKDKRNLVFSRQGSSTDAKDGISYEETRSIRTIFSNGKSSSTEKDHNGNTNTYEKIVVREKNFRNLSATELVEMNELESKKTNIKNKKEDPDVKKVVDKHVDVSKSVPRYMQWYNNKNSGSKQTETKVIPPKPKRAINKNKVQDMEEKKTRISEEAKKNSNYQKHVNIDRNKKPSTIKEEKDVKVHSRLMKEEKVKAVPEGPLPDTHPLLQHSEHRYEHQYLNQNPMCFVQPTHMPQYLGMQSQLLMARPDGQLQPVYVNQIPVNLPQTVSSQNGPMTTVYLKPSEDPKMEEGNIKNDSLKLQETSSDLSNKDNINVTIKHVKTIEDDDSGIAMMSVMNNHIKRIPMTEKQSVFTIAYNEVQTKQLRPDSSTPSY